ncbi:hypothetical protein JCM13210_03700 [Thermaerobacter litoralis]
MIVRLVYDLGLGAWRLERPDGDGAGARRLEIVWTVDAERLRRELAVVPAGSSSEITVGVKIPRDLLAVAFQS